jgi:hypothetical protein
MAITPAQAPAAAFGASVGAAGEASFDASASTDSDATVARYAWDFGDGETETLSTPTTTHTYASPGTYTATLTVTDSDGCSTALVFTGQTAYCNGAATARVQHDVVVPEPKPAVPAPPAEPAAPPAAAAPHPKRRPLRQKIERFSVDARCVRASRSGTARIGLKLRLARTGKVEVQVDRATDAQALDACPKPNSGRRYEGDLRDLKQVKSAAAAAVTRRLALSLKLQPGLYRITVRAHTSGNHLSRPATRWVRVLG